MLEQVLERIDQLITEGGMVAYKRDRNDYWVADLPRAQSWLSSAANAILQIAPLGSFFKSEIERLTSHQDLVNGIPVHLVEKIQGVLQSVRNEANNGLLRKIEYQVFATAFDDFLDHAASFHRSGKTKESAILASAVLEDTLKRIAAKNRLTSSGISLEPLIDDLTKNNIFTEVKAKRIKSYAGVRNAALHADWDKLDIRDVGKLIEGVRELLENYL